MRVNGAYREAYNAQTSVAGEQGIIVAATVGNNVDDTENLLKMEELVRDSLAESERDRLAEAKYLYDTGYYSPTNILDAHERGVDLYIPERTDARYYRDQNSASERTSIGTADCEIDEDEQGLYLRCPGGRTLRKWRLRNSNGTESYEFKVRSSDEPCLGCQFYKVCVGKHKTPQKSFSIRKRQFDQRETLAAYKAKMDSEIGKRICSRRMPLIERPYAYVKETIGFTRFFRRGLEKALNEWLLVCGAYNLRRMFTLSTT